MESVKRFIAVGLAPELTELTKDFTDLLAANKDWIIDGIKATVGVLDDLVGMLIRVAPVILGVGLAVGAVNLATLGLIGTIRVLQKLTLVAFIIGIILIVDDLIVALRGGKSFIREFFLEFFEYDITPLLKDIVKGFEEVGETLRNFGGGNLESFKNNGQE